MANPVSAFGLERICLAMFSALMLKPTLSSSVSTAYFHQTL